MSLDKTRNVLNAVVTSESIYRSLSAVAATGEAGRKKLLAELEIMTVSTSTAALVEPIRRVVAERVDDILEQALVAAATRYRAARSAALAHLQQPIAGLDDKDA